MKPSRVLVRYVGRTLTVAVLWSATAHAESVRQQEFGAAWPLTVSAGDLRCELVRIEGGPTRPAVTFTPSGGGKQYAVNGAAASLGRGLPVDELVRRENRGTVGSGQALLLPMSVSPLIDRGLKLCGVGPASVPLDPGHEIGAPSGDTEDGSFFLKMGLWMAAMVGCILYLRSVFRRNNW
jgi:hypothetical protein